MLSPWRWIGPTLLLATLLGAFMALDRTTLHWYVPESNGSAVSNAAPTPARDTNAAATSTAVPRFAAAEVQALALQFATQTFQTLGGYDCGTPLLNEAHSRWTSICTERATQRAPMIVVVAVNAVTGLAADLTTAVEYNDNTATVIASTAIATAAKTPQPASPP